MSCFVTTSKGFVVKKEVIKEEREGTFPLIRTEIIYTDSLRKAWVFPSAGKAQDFMDKNGIEGFIFSPWKQEENLEPKYEVAKRTRYGWDEEGQTKVEEFYPRKAWQKGDSDAAFIQMKKETPRPLYSFEGAKEECLRRNYQMLGDLEKKIQMISNITEEEARRYS